MRALPALLVLLLSVTHLWAAPQRYALDAEKSQVSFAWDFGKDEVKGLMPVASAALTIDFARVANSTVEVAVDVTGARAGFPFATQAMKGPKILHAAQFPEIAFTSTQVRANGAGALIDGFITVRGVTRPMTFVAEIFRQRVPPLRLEQAELFQRRAQSNLSRAIGAIVDFYHQP